MKTTSLIFPVMFLIACIFALIIMGKQNTPGGDWETINDWLIILIPSLLGVIIGIFYLFKRG